MCIFFSILIIEKIFMSILSRIIPFLLLSEIGRKMPKFKLTPMLVLTTENSEEIKKEGKSAGATDWLEKPMKPKQLIATIEKLVA